MGDEWCSYTWPSAWERPSWAGHTRFLVIIVILFLVFVWSYWSHRYGQVWLTTSQMYWWKLTGHLSLWPWPRRERVYAVSWSFNRTHPWILLTHLSFRITSNTSNYLKVKVKKWHLAGILSKPDNLQRSGIVPACKAVTLTTAISTAPSGVAICLLTHSVVAQALRPLH